MIKASLVDMF